MKTFSKKISLILAIVLAALINQAQNIEWMKSFGGSVTEGRGIAADNSGNIYTLGIFNNTASFGSFTLTATGNNDIYISKEDALGNVLWVKSFGGPNVFAVSYGAISVDVSGSIYVSGTIDGAAVFGTTTLTPNGQDDFICKIDANGGVIWAQLLSNTNDLVVSGITSDASGSLYTTGTFSGTVNIGASSLTSSGSYDIFVAKFDPNGSVVWTKKMGGAGTDRGVSIKSDGTGNLYTTGYFSGVSTFAPFSLTSSGNTDVYLAKMDNSGTIIWSKRFGGPNYDEGDKICIASPNYIYTTGTFSNSIVIGTHTVTTGNNYITKVDVSGNVGWVKQFGDGMGNYAYIFGIASDAGNNVYTTGSFGGMVAFGTNTLSAAIITATSQSVDGFISKLDSAGNFLWVKHVGATGFASGNDIFTRSGKVYSVGSFGGTVTIDNFTYSTTATNQINAYYLKLDPGPVGIEENYKAINVKVYPNPANDKLIIESEAFHQNTQLVITDLLGKEILKQNSINSKTETLDVSTLLPGVYFLRINSGKESGVVKIVKE